MIRAVQAFKAGCLILAVALAIDVAALLLDWFNSGMYAGFEGTLHAELLGAASSSVVLLSLACFSHAVPPSEGVLARRPAAVFWTLIAAGALFFVLRWVPWAVGLGHRVSPWIRLADLAMWAAIGWAFVARPLGSAQGFARVAPILIGGACIISLAVGVALSWDGFRNFDRGNLAFQVGALLALAAVAFGFATRSAKTPASAA
jgi:hypothetical protein